MTMFNNPTQNKLYEAWAQTVFKASTLITDTVGLGFRPVWSDLFKYIQKRIDFNNISKNAWILVLNDFDLTATKALRERGYYNIIMLVTDTTQEQTPTTYFFDVKFNDRKFKKLFPNGWSEIWKDVWFMNAVEVQDIGAKGKLLKSTHIEYKIQGDITKVNFDLIIANPPYGKIGAQITDTIRKEVKYNHFINLLPAKDYFRADNKDLYAYLDLDTIEAVRGAFDAAIVPVVAQVTKTSNATTKYQFISKTFDDLTLIKYFTANELRKQPKTCCNIPSGNIGFNILIPTRLSSGDHSGEYHLPYSRTAATYKANFGLVATYEEAAGTSKYLGSCSIMFLSATERDNFRQFMYHKDGFRFLSKIFTSMHQDTLTEITHWFPKVDWTRAWTVEEILADYGYTEAEIAEVMSDLENFRDMERD